MLRIFSKKQKGANLVEYALLAALLSIVAMGAISALGTKVSGGFSMVDATMSTAVK